MSLPVLCWYPSGRVGNSFQESKVEARRPVMRFFQQSRKDILVVQTRVVVTTVWYKIYSEDVTNRIY